MKKKILIFGITGQDGAYLANLLLKKNFIVHGTSRTNKNWDRNLNKLSITKKIKIFKINKKNNSIYDLLKNNYNYIYFLGGQSSVNKSFVELEKETFDTQIIPLKEVLEYIRKQKLPKSKFLFASSSEIFGDQKKTRLNETSTKNPNSPYGLSKLIGLEVIKSYRNMFDLPVFSIIFFNHESVLRDKNFVIKKVINYLKNKNYKKKLELGNIDVKRDWGSSNEYMEIINRIMLSKKIDDYVLATGTTTKLRKIIDLLFKKYNLNYLNYIKINKKYIRKFDIKANYADISKLKKQFNLSPQFKIKKIINLFNEH
jgi:GDPmannose 4,6-dehydratase